MTPGERGLDALFDPGFKLLKNGGIVTTFLLQSGFDLVLHGHEHQAFAASVGYLDVRGPRKLVVVGGVAAKEGFQVVRFCSRGGVVLERYLYTVPLGSYAHDKHPVTLWTHANWQEMDWLRESRAEGRYNRLELRQSLTAIGDFTSIHDVTDILAGAGKTIDRLERRLGTAPDHLGTCEISRIFDKQNMREMRKDELPRVAPKIEYTLMLQPPALAESAHKGFIIKSETYNGFAITAEDASLRKQREAVERVIFRVKYPSREVSYRLEFPQGFAPDSVSIDVWDMTEGQIFDFAETAWACRVKASNSSNVIPSISVRRRPVAEGPSYGS